jgi:hypothetical protein
MFEYSQYFDRWRILVKMRRLERSEEEREVREE